MFDLTGCWEHVPAEPSQPIQRRRYEVMAGQTYHYYGSSVDRVTQDLTQPGEKGTATYLPAQKKLRTYISSRSRLDPLVKTDDTTLEIDGLIFTKLDQDSCWKEPK